MIERGVVIKNKGKFVQVRIERNSACGSCGKCGMTEKQKHADFYVENSCNAVSGDIVDINIPEANTARLAFVAYILPIIPALALLFLSVGMQWKEWLSVLLFFVGLTVGFIVIALIDKFRRHKWAESPTMEAIVKNINISNNIEKNEGEDINE